MLLTIAMLRGPIFEWHEGISIIFLFLLVYAGPPVWLSALVFQVWAAVRPKTAPAKWILRTTVLVAVASLAAVWVLVSFGRQLEGSPSVPLLCVVIGFGILCVVGAVVHRSRAQHD